VFLFCLSSSCVPYVAGLSGLFLFCLSSSCVPYVAGLSGLSIFDWHFGLGIKVMAFNATFINILVIL
jgi:hypothetical protein